ncbi:MAG: TetR/AcrR family transcriptional regulator [Persicimonas sp.]
MKRLPTEQRRKQIAEAALRIIAERGLRRFTVAAISEEVGLADGTIFRHFEDKDDIVLEAVNQLEQALIAHESSRAGAPEAEFEGDSLDRLGMFLRRRIALIRERPEIAKALFSDDLAQAGPEEAGERVRALKHRSMQYVRNHLQQALDQGLISEEHDADELLYLVHGTALAIVFSDEDLSTVTDRTIEPEAIWHAVETMLRADAD